MDWGPVVRKCIGSCVLVQITGRDSISNKHVGIPSSKAENGITTLSASGVVVDAQQGLIVTSGTIIIPFLAQSESSKMPKDNHTLVGGTTVSVLLHDPSEPIQNSWAEVSLVGVWACEKVGQCVRKLHSEFQYRLETGWCDLVDSQSDSESSTTRDSWTTSITEFVAVLRVPKLPNKIASVTFANSNKLALAQPIVVVGSPFGCISPISFFNSVSSGVISHSFHGPSDSADLIMTDARSLPGTEGGGVFDTAGDLVGVVAPRVTSTDSPMDLNFIIPSNQIADILANIGNVTLNDSTEEVFLPTHIRLAKKSVVCLQIGNMWASGMVVSNNGHILTNAHLFKSVIKEMTRDSPIPVQEYDQLKVKVFFHKPVEPVSPGPADKRFVDTAKGCVQARVEYISHNHLDIAMLQVCQEDRASFTQFVLPVKASLSVDTAIGMPVWAVAHGFAPEQGMETVCSHGLVANVIHRDGMPASLQTSASIHGGNSGGLLVNSNGELVGMIMSHASHKGVRTFTRLNFAIPYHQFITLINYANGEDKHAPERLRGQPMDNFLASLWKFIPEPKERPPAGPSFMKFMEQMKSQEMPLPKRSPLPKSKL